MPPSRRSILSTVRKMWQIKRGLADQKSGVTDSLVRIKYCFVGIRTYVFKEKWSVEFCRGEYIVGSWWLVAMVRIAKIWFGPEIKRGVGFSPRFPGFSNQNSRLVMVHTIFRDQVRVPKRSNFSPRFQVFRHLSLYGPWWPYSSSQLLDTLLQARAKYLRELCWNLWW